MHTADLTEVTVTSEAFGMPNEQTLQLLRMATAEMRRRQLILVGGRQRQWSGPDLRVIVVPSIEVLADQLARGRVEELARFGRKSGVKLILINDFRRAADPPVGLELFGGSRLLRDLVAGPHTSAAGHHCWNIAPAQLDQIARNAANDAKQIMNR